MRALIDQLENELQAFEELRGVNVKAFGWYSADVPHPSECPAVNIYPRRKPGERVFIMGADPEYNVDVEIGMVCWHYSMKDLREAFNRCENLAETVQSVLAKINARNSLQVHYFSTTIEEFVDVEYDNSFMYGAEVVMTARKSETRST
jgi:hypothetical protein